jgi:hypothetical protein
VDTVSRAKITLDPFGVVGLPELVYVTSHAASATTATIQRIAGQPLRTHNAAETWVHGPVAEDFTEFQSQLDNQFHTSVFTQAQQLLSSSGAGVPSAINKGTEAQSLTMQGGALVWKNPVGKRVSLLLTGGPTVGGNVATLGSVVIPTQAQTYALTLTGYWCGYNDTLADHFQFVLNVNGSPVAFGSERHSGSANERRIYALPTSLESIITAGNTATISATIQRIGGTGTITEQNSGMLTANFVWQ